MRIDGLTPESLGKLSPSAQLAVKSASAFAGYGEGDSLRAQVVSVKGDLLGILLENGKLASAQLQANVSLLVGDTVDLLVTFSGAKGLTLRISALNGQNIAPEVPVGEEKLLQAGIDASPRNAANAQTLTALSLPVRPQTLRAMDEGLRAFPSLPREQAAFMAANSIEINAENNKTVSVWLQSAPLIGAIAQPLREAADALPAPAQAPPPSQDAAAPIAQSASAAVEPSSEELHARVAPFFDRLSEPAADAVRSVPQYETALHKLLQTLPSERGAQALSFLRSLPQGAPPDAKTAVLSALLGAPILPVQGESPAPSAQPAQAAISTADASQTFQPEAPTDTQPAPTQSDAPEKAEQPQRQASAAHTKADSADLPAKSTSRSTSDAIRQLVETLFARLDADKPDAKELRDAVRSVDSKLHALRELLPAQEGEPFRAAAQNLDQLISQNKMGAELSNFTYAQLPFRLNEQEQTAELYVLRRSAKKPNGSNSYTILLSLSTESMGTVESVLKFENRSLQLNLRIGDPQVRDFVTERLGELRELLASTPFRLQSVQVKGIDEPLTPLTVSRIAHGETGVALGGIDVRA